MATRLEISGPLVPYVEQIRGVLERPGHTPLTIREAVWMVARLDAWLIGEGLGCDALTAETVERFLASRRAGGERTYITAKWFESVFGCLRASGAAPALQAVAPVTSDELLIVRYHERRLLGQARRETPRGVHGCRRARPPHPRRRRHPVAGGVDGLVCDDDGGRYRPGDQRPAPQGLHADAWLEVKLMARYASTTFTGIAKEDHKIRSSIYSTAALALDPWLEPWEWHPIPRSTCVACCAAMWPRSWWRDDGG
jgi:hypothetical protein